MSVLLYEILFEITSNILFKIKSQKVTPNEFANELQGNDRK